MEREKVEVKEFLGTIEFVDLQSALKTLKKEDIKVAGVVFGDPRVTGGYVKAILAKVEVQSSYTPPQEKRVAWIYM